MKINRTRAVAAAGALTLGALSVFGTTAAQAAVTDFGNIDPAREGSLTVHKFLHQAGTHTGEVSEAPAAGDFTDPVAGVEFTVFPLVKDGAQLDLTVADHWNALQGVTSPASCVAPAGFTLGAGIPMPVTGTTGSSTIDLDLSAYLVCETDAPANIVDTAAPFILTVPLASQNGWVYDVHAYPKNGAASIQKTIVAQEGFGLGASVKFPVTSAIPTMQGQAWTAYSISDTFDPRLTPDGVSSVTVDGVDLDESYYEIITDGQTVVMQFTTMGIASLNTGAQAGKVIEVVFEGLVNEVGNGTIANEAQLWVNNPDRDENVKPPVPSNEVHTHWGALEVTKRAAGTTGTTGLLTGAAFEVYAAADPYAADCTDAEPAGSAIVVNGATQFTSTNGVITIPGLFVSDSVNPTIDAAERCYVLKEVAAPAGYILPQGDLALTGVAVQIGETTTAENAEIENTQQQSFTLPLTGGSGTAILISAGVAGGLLALGLALVKRRRKNADEMGA